MCKNFPNQLLRIGTPGLLDCMTIEYVGVQERSRQSVRTSDSADDSVRSSFACTAAINSRYGGILVVSVLWCGEVDSFH